MFLGSPGFLVLMVEREGPGILHFVGCGFDCSNWTCAKFFTVNKLQGAAVGVSEENQRVWAALETVAGSEKRRLVTASHGQKAATATSNITIGSIG